MKISVLLAGISISVMLGTVHGQEVYKIEKEDGTVVYTDTPSKQSEPVTFEAKTSNVAQSLPVSSPKPVSPQDNAAKRQAQPTPDYQVSVSHPAPEATVRDNSGSMTIRASSQPKSSGPYQLTMNGEIVKTSANGEFSLTGVNRGTHTFSIQLLDKSGKTLASSNEQTFYMHQASALINTQNSQ
ncbi:DUF4124 domain-containing protein [Salinimonas sp. HHU 13199]|uniref:DUF4124 domain-containing protein n=1 Tax=Salinimonas profundi TaxID=2729140 RepID=A0ABR8LKW2_9ALTE|nr:DUF4124 domain-containing protein [Salinimonas profundi]MBD3586208.1 DUF4124 domain-containing protein [Salinimonas profundi]